MGLSKVSAFIIQIPWVSPCTIVLQTQPTCRSIAGQVWWLFSRRHWSVSCIDVTPQLHDCINCLGHSARFISTKWISSSTQLENEGTIPSFQAVSIRFIGSEQNLQSLCWTDWRLCEAESMALSYSNQIHSWFVSISSSPFSTLLGFCRCEIASKSIQITLIWTNPNAACLVKCNFNFRQNA